MKYIYFGDLNGDLEEERDMIKGQLKDAGINVEIDITDVPPFDDAFDVLFFDWGGMSIGNSMMEHFCREFLGMADECPNRIFVMVSMFTAMAMEDALEYVNRFDDPPANLFLNLEKAIPLIKAWELKNER